MNIYHAHDLAFKKALKDQRVAIDLLNQHLPGTIKAMVDLSTLTLCSELFISPELRELNTDVLFSAVLKKGTKKRNVPVFFYLHLEQQTDADPMMAWRMVKSAVFIMDYHLQQEKSRYPNRKKHVLPIIIPLVLYSGKNPYPYSVDVFDLFGEHQLTAQAWMFRQFKLIDLSVIPDETLRQHAWAGLLEMVMKHIKDAEFMAFLETITPLFKQMIKENIHDYVVSMLSYILSKAELGDKKAYFDWMRNHLPEPLEKEAMTIAEQLRNEGMEEGIEKGIEKAKMEDALEIVKQTSNFELASTVTKLPVEKIKSFIETMKT